MDILYVVGEGCSDCSDLELRCSLRSIALYGRGIDRVFVVGYCPSWLSEEVIKIPHEKRFSNPVNNTEKALNIADSILYALDNSDIGDEFLVSMDDHFYTRSVNFNNYPYYVRRVLGSEYLPELEKGNTDYRRFLAETREYLESKGLPTLNFTLHRNMHLGRKWISECKEYIDEIFENRQACEFFCLINNYRYSQTQEEYKVVNDIKITSGSDWWKIDPKTTEVFSLSNFTHGLGFEPLLEMEYMDKCKYERSFEEVSKPAVSIIVPVYNSESYLRRCLNSLSSQALENIEILCINDGSFDESQITLREYMARDRRIRIIKQENKGPAGARNTGIENARGKYIGFVDSDDWVDDGFFEELYNNKKSYDVIIGTKVHGRFGKHTTKDVSFGSEITTALIKKSFIDEHSIRFDENMASGEDTKFLEECRSQGASMYELSDNGIYYHYMIREGSLNNYKRSLVESINTIDRARSFPDFKQNIKNYIFDNFTEEAKILDVGAGSGTYAKLLDGRYKNLDAVEVYEPNIIDYGLREKYSNVFLEDIRGFEYGNYDLIIFGDILEHISIEDAKAVLEYALNHSEQVLVAIPFLNQQRANINPYEEHIQEDLTAEVMETRYPELMPLFINERCGYYIKNNA